MFIKIKSTSNDIYIINIDYVKRLMIGCSISGKSYIGIEYDKGMSENFYSFDNDVKNAMKFIDAEITKQTLSNF